VWLQNPNTFLGPGLERPPTFGERGHKLREDSCRGGLCQKDSGLPSIGFYLSKGNDSSRSSKGGEGFIPTIFVGDPFPTIKKEPLRVTLKGKEKKLPSLRGKKKRSGKVRGQPPWSNVERRIVMVSAEKTLAGGGGPVRGSVPQRFTEERSTKWSNHPSVVS